MSPLPGSSAGPLLKEMPISRSFYTYLPGAPLMKSPPPGSLRERDRERDAPPLEPPSSISQSPWQMSPLPASPAEPLWR